MQSSILARSVESNATVGIIAASAPSQRERFRTGVAALEAYGFKTKIPIDPSAAYGSTGHLFASAAPTERARALTELVLDEDVRVIISVRGAYGSQELLPHMNYDDFRNNPKPIVGLSDTTALLLAAYCKAGIRCIHGPSIESAFSKADTEAAKQSCDALIGHLTGTRRPLEEIPFQHYLGGSEARGRLVGGNLSMIQSMLGTPWEPSFEDHVLFLEEIGEKPYRVHRMLLQLQYAGKFDGVRGVLLGSFVDCEFHSGPTLDHVLGDIFGNLKLPVWRTDLFGHKNPNLPLEIGAEISVSGASARYTE